MQPLPDGPGILNFEREVVIPAIEGMKLILKSATKSLTVKRIVLTSSFEALLDLYRDASVPYTYTTEDWSTVTYEQAVSTTEPAIAYLVSKKFAELEAWNWVRSLSSVNADGEKIDLTVFCPAYALGPWVHPLESLSSISTSNRVLRDMVLGITKNPAIAARASTWVDVRDLALAHVEAAYI